VSEKRGVKLHRRAPKLDDLGVSVATYSVCVGCQGKIPLHRNNSNGGTISVLFAADKYAV
jgi:hypothetical protein